MKEQALKVFRQPPDRLNCAQSVVCAWREVFGDLSDRRDASTRDGTGGLRTD